MTWVLVFSVELLVVYAIFIFRYVLYSKCNIERDFESKIKPLVSIMIVARNEVSTIPSLFLSLAKQNYPADRIELLVFDDSSTDETLAELNRLCTQVNFKVTLFSGNRIQISGKKGAISFLAKKATGDLFLFTDADVVVPDNWVLSMMDGFYNPDTEMVCGAVSFSNRNTFFEKLLALEFAAMIETSLNAIRNSLPFMCNAANMAIRASAYKECAVYDANGVSSGDDTDLLRAVSVTFGNSAIVANFNSNVSTISATSFIDFLNQRIRWAGKSTKKFWMNPFFVGLLIFLISLWSLALFVSSFWIPKFALYLCFFAFAKWILDLCVLAKYRNKFTLFNGWYFYSIALSLVYPFYVVVVALLSLKSTYLWKERVVK